VQRIVRLGGAVDDDNSNLLVAQLLYLDSIGKKDITMYVNSPGGSVTAGWSLPHHYLSTGIILWITSKLSLHVHQFPSILRNCHIYVAHIELLRLTVMLHDTAIQLVIGFIAPAEVLCVTDFHAAHACHVAELDWHLGAGMAVFDTMRYIKSDVSTVCVGLAASMGAFILASGQKVPFLSPIDSSLCTATFGECG